MLTHLLLRLPPYPPAVLCRFDGIWIVELFGDRVPGVGGPSFRGRNFLRRPGSGLSACCICEVMGVEQPATGCSPPLTASSQLGYVF